MDVDVVAIVIDLWEELKVKADIELEGNI